MTDAFEEKYSVDFGRQLISRKKFEPGDTVFVEDALILSPSSNTLEKDLPSGNFLCFACCKVIVKSKSLRCSDCGWFACSKACLEEPWHKHFECSVFGKEKVVPSYFGLRNVYLVRSLLMKEKNEKKWAAILNLTSNRTHKDATYESEFTNVSNRAYSFLTDECKMAVDRILMEQLIHTFVMNAFSMIYKDKIGNSYVGGGIFATCCLINHSCYSNIQWVFLPFDDNGLERWRMTLIASKTIEIGEAITISYVNYDLCGTMERRQKLASSLLFLCKCVRCCDSTELGSNFSGIICPSCKDVMLPAKPLDLNSEWACRKCQQTLTKLSVDRLEKNFECSREAISRNTNNIECCKQLDSLIGKCSNRYLLFENNRNVISAIMMWLSRMDLDVLFGFSDEVDAIYQTLMERAKQCHSVYSSIGALADLVSCEWLIAKIIIKYRFKSKNCLSIEYDEYSITDKVTILKRIVKHLSRGLVVMKRYNYVNYGNNYLSHPEDVYHFYSEQLSIYQCTDTLEALPLLFQTQM